MHFLGMAGYYRKLCNNVSSVSAPLTDLLKTNCKFVCNETCQNSYKNIKAMLVNAPVLLAPNFCKPFKLAVDASDVGAGGVLLQEDENGVDHPVCYFSHKFNKHQKVYSTIEKECLALILSLQFFEPHLGGSVVSVSDSLPGGCEFDSRLRRLFFRVYFHLSPLQKHVRKVVGGFGKKVVLVLV